MVGRKPRAVGARLGVVPRPVVSLWKVIQLGELCSCQAQPSDGRGALWGEHLAGHCDYLSLAVLGSSPSAHVRKITQAAVTLRLGGPSSEDFGALVRV